MYHDQGLPVIKHGAFGSIVNITLGLPIIRTSVDHGTAYGIAGKGVADTGESATCTVSCRYFVPQAKEMTANKKRKKLGQHFLADAQVIDDIVGLINADANETIVEIGPGRGALTRHLARPDIDFHAIEIRPETGSSVEI